MRDEELKLYIELAPKLNEYRGSWQTRDNCYHKGYGKIGSVYYTLNLREKKISVKLDDVALLEMEVNSSALIWLPFPIDPLDPERIARGEKPRGLMFIIQDFLSLFLFMGEWKVAAKMSDKPFIVQEFSGDTPTEALLLCLKEQWEGKSVYRNG